METNGRSVTMSRATFSRSWNGPAWPSALANTSCSRPMGRAGMRRSSRAVAQATVKRPARPTASQTIFLPRLAQSRLRTRTPTCCVPILNRGFRTLRSANRSWPLLASSEVTPCPYAAVFGSPMPPMKRELRPHPNFAVAVMRGRPSRPGRVPSAARGGSRCTALLGGIWPRSPWPKSWDSSSSAVTCMSRDGQPYPATVLSCTRALSTRPQRCCFPPPKKSAPRRSSASWTAPCRGPAAAASCCSRGARSRRRRRKATSRRSAPNYSFFQLNAPLPRAVV